MQSHHFNLRIVCFIVLCAFLNTTFFIPVADVFAGQSEEVNKAEGEGYNPNSSVKINPETGLPYGALGYYTPAEKNPLLGKAVFLTPLECVQKYGLHFCECADLEDGTKFCYYKRPSEGFYTTKESCEEVWGAGMCICPEGETCRLYEPEEMANALECQGEVLFFSGEKMECRQSGVMSGWKNCCTDKSKGSSACSFENISKEIGMDDIASLALSLGTALSSLAGYDPKEFLCKEIAKVVVQNWLEAGSIEGLVASLTQLIGGDAANMAIAQIEWQMQVLGPDIIKQSIEMGAENAADGIVQSMASEAGQQLVGEVAATLGTVISIAGWVYFAYKVYNMFTALRQCTAGELMLSCKRAKGVCHKVGTRCKTKVLGSCLQKIGVYCCFNSVIARIIHEQGRPQVGFSWGSAKRPQCRGFRMDEFARVDLSDVDFAEYQEDLIRELNPNIQKKYKEAMNKLNESFVYQ